MTAYPDIITGVPSTVPLEWTDNFRVLSNEFENGQESRRLIDGFVKRKVVVNYEPMHYDQANTLRRFYESVKGPFNTFSFFFPQHEIYIKELVGVVTSSSVGNATLVLPAKTSISHTLYKNNTAVGQYTVQQGAGPDGEDLAVLGSVSFEPGDIFSYSFTGRLKIKARFSFSPYIIRDTKDLYSASRVELESLYPSEIVI